MTPREELADLVASTRELIAWYEEAGSEGLDARRSKAAAPVASPVAPFTQPPAHFPPPAAPVAQPAAPFAFPATPVAQPAAPVASPAAPVAQPPAHFPPPAQLSNDERITRLALVQEEVRDCTKCALSATRTNTVFARGNPFSELCFIGEGPGADEDAQGEPFVGKAGQLLDRMIQAMGYARDEVYICNVVKCRPPDNRKPEPNEMATCAPYLKEQLALVAPKVIVALGATAVNGLTGSSEGITRMRGKWKLYKGSIPIMPTFHPAYLLRQPSAKRDVWNDLQEVMKHLGKSPSRTPA